MQKGYILNIDKLLWNIVLYLFISIIQLYDISQYNVFKLYKVRVNMFYEFHTYYIKILTFCLRNKWLIRFYINDELF